MPKAAGKSGRKSGGSRPPSRKPGTFASGKDPRRGRGPKPGAPNAGRPKSAIRARMRDALADRLGIAQTIADDVNQTPADRMRALDFLAKYGLGARNTTQKHEHAGKNGEALPAQVWVVGGREIRFT